jgi:diguanylate cyclase (GGDEF)-like protein
MKPFSGNIARKIIITYSSLALIIVLISIGSIMGIRYAHQMLIVDAHRQEEVALLSAHIRSEALFLTNTIQQYTATPGSGQVERQIIDNQIGLLENLLQQAVNSVNPNDVDESIAVGLIRQYLIAFNVQSRRVMNTSDDEGNLGTETRRQMNTLLNHYQPALIESLEAFEKLERTAAEETFARAEQYAAYIAAFLIMLSIIAIVLAAAMSLWLMKRFIIPLTVLTENVRLLPNISMDIPIDITTNDEMGALAQALNNMKMDINESHHKLEQYAATLEAQVEERTRELKLLAITDPLTGLYNRRHFFSLAEQLFTEAKRLNHPFSVAIFDIDHFKLINDHFGHAVGDLALKQATQVMQFQIRQMDVLGRYGGEEFIVALPTATLEKALQIAQRIAAALREHKFENDGQYFNITISGGIAHRNGSINEDLENILLKADKALYQAKTKGRDLIVAYHSVIANKETA